MNRLISILLFFCGIVVCAFLAYFGYQQQLKADQIDAQPPEITCREILKGVPDGTSALTFTQFQSGKHFAPFDYEDDGTWEKVYVPFFPSDLRKLGVNYKAIIICFVDVPNLLELQSRIKSGAIESQYWSASQTLDREAYNRLAEKYSSMDFDRSIILHSGYPKTKSSLGTYLFWGASGGAVLSLLGLLWQTMSLIIAGIRSESEEDDDDVVVTNRAGLPTR